VGAECKHGGNIHSSIINEAKVAVVVPTTPACSTDYPETMTMSWALRQAGGASLGHSAWVLFSNQRPQTTGNEALHDET